MEFGSDFHSLNYPLGDSLTKIIPYANYYASGRQALKSLIMNNGWSRMWVPSYFCEDSLYYIVNDIEIKRYNCSPLDDPHMALLSFEPSENDAVFIVNYFGKYHTRHFIDTKATIIEDHTHDLIGDWARESTAHWCIASLRKTLPVADGGILWSPRKLTLPPEPAENIFHSNSIMQRWNAMDMKTDYLNGLSEDKGTYLPIFQKTEADFESLPVSPISQRSKTIVETLGIEKWYRIKNSNWQFLYSLLRNDLKEAVMPAEIGTNHFSMIFIFKDGGTRDEFRKYLIQNNVFPAILWRSETETQFESCKISERILSIHCDARYNCKQIKTLATILNNFHHDSIDYIQ